MYRSVIVIVLRNIQDGDCVLAQSMAGVNLCLTWPSPQLTSMYLVSMPVRMFFIQCKGCLLADLIDDRLILKTHIKDLHPRRE